jgi:NAD(P)-dependent dehydrogenase (short-subunit alcohol dehydrogenase family)
MMRIMTADGTGRMKGRRVLVIGGGQSDYDLDDPPLGNGRAISILLAREGASVAVADINEDAAKATAELADAEGGTAVALKVDAADEESMVAAIGATREQLGGIDGLMLNVGIGGGFKLEGTSVEDWDRVMAVNVRAHFLGCKHGIPAMEDGGAVVLMGSVAATQAIPVPAYSVSKAALEALTRNAAIEGAPNVRVNLLVPGLIDTPLGRIATKLVPKRAEIRIPAGRQGTAWEMADAALFLLSDQSSYMTGQGLVVDGGLSISPRM